MKKRHRHGAVRRSRKCGEGTYLVLPSWASINCEVCKNPPDTLCYLSIPLKKHRPIPEDSFATVPMFKNRRARGLLFHFPEFLQPGTILNMDISIKPESEPVRVRVEVEHITPGMNDKWYLVGTCFVASGDREIENLTYFIKKNYR